MTDRPRSGGSPRDGLKLLLALLALLIVIGVLVGFAIAAIGPSQDPNVGGAVPQPPSAADPVVRPLA